MRLTIWLAATRPAFLSVTLVAVCIGLAASLHEHAFRSVPLTLITLLFALVGHAGANVINDYYDARSGCDTANNARIAPFTGGSRLIQNGILSERTTGIYGYTLLALVIPAGLWLISQSGPLLLGIGLVGLLSGWAYSAPPLKLQSRGLGEIAIMLAWLAVVIGSAYVQSQKLDASALYAGLAYAPLVANVLFVNQVPDRIADAQVGKNTLIVRCTSVIAPWGSLGLYAASTLVLTAGIFSQQVPVYSGLSIFAGIPAIVALRALFANPTDPCQLRVAIPMTIVSCLLAGILIAAGLLL
jgi:1,4-dihydroxy-2-naphthoate octaprenyltransferase